MAADRANVKVAVLIQSCERPGYQGRGQRVGRGSFLPEPKPKPGASGTAAAVGSRVPRPAGPLLVEEYQWSQQPSRCHPCSCYHNQLQILLDNSVQMPRRRPYWIQLCGWRLCVGARETGVGNASCLRG